LKKLTKKSGKPSCLENQKQKTIKKAVIPDLSFQMGVNRGNRVLLDPIKLNKLRKEYVGQRKWRTLGFVEGRRRQGQEGKRWNTLTISGKKKQY